MFPFIYKTVIREGNKRNRARNRLCCPDKGRPTIPLTLNYFTGHANCTVINQRGPASILAISFSHCTYKISTEALAGGLT